MLADTQIYLRDQWAAVPLLNVPQQLFAAPKGKIAPGSRCAPANAPTGTTSHQASTGRHVTPGGSE